MFSRSISRESGKTTTTTTAFVTTTKAVVEMGSEIRSIGSLSNSVFERRTSTGSGLFAALGCSLVETLR